MLLRIWIFPQAGVSQESPTPVVLSLFCHRSHGAPETELQVVSQPMTLWIMKDPQWLHQVIVPWQIVSWAAHGVSRAKKPAAAHMESHVSWGLARLSVLSSQVQVSSTPLGKGASNAWMTASSLDSMVHPAIKSTGLFEFSFRVWKLYSSSLFSPVLHGYLQFHLNFLCIHGFLCGHGFLYLSTTTGWGTWHKFIRWFLLLVAFIHVDK